MATADFHHKHDVVDVDQYHSSPSSQGRTSIITSPVLVPAAIVMFLIAAGFVFSGGCGVAAITALTWLIKYVSDYISTGRRNYTYDGSYASRAQFGRL
ncbi:hypothetical protein ACLB2K_017734 [Fragaria x ananassa]